MVALYGTPKILVLRWIVLLLGFGTAPAIAYGAIHGFFPILVTVMGAVRDVDPHLSVEGNIKVLRGAWERRRR